MAESTTAVLGLETNGKGVGLDRSATRIETDRGQSELAREPSSHLPTAGRRTMTATW